MSGTPSPRSKSEFCATRTEPAATDAPPTAMMMYGNGRARPRNTRACRRTCFVWCRPRTQPARRKRKRKRQEQLGASCERRYTSCIHVGKGPAGKNVRITSFAWEICWLQRLACSKKRIRSGARRRHLRPHESRGAHVLSLLQKQRRRSLAALRRRDERNPRVDQRERRPKTMTHFAGSIARSTCSSITWSRMERPSACFSDKPCAATHRSTRCANRFARRS